MRPALAAGRPVVSDRSVYSTLAYQGYGRGLDLDELRRINDWAIGGLWPDRVVLLDAPTDVLAGAHPRPRPRPLRAGRRRLPRPRRRRLPRDGRRRPGALDGRRRRRRRRHGGRAACAPRYDELGVGVTSVWDDVVGQPAAVAAARRGRRRRRCTPTCFVGPSGSTKHEAARAFAALLLAGVDDPAAATPAWRCAAEHPDVHEVERAGPAISADQADEIVQLDVAGPGRGRAQGPRPPRVPPARPPRPRRRLLKIDRGAAAVDDVRRPRRLRAAGAGHDRLALRADRLPRHPRRRDRGPAASPRASTPTIVARRVAAAGGDLDRARILAADPALVERRRAFAGAAARLDGTGATVVRPSTSCWR